MSFFDSFFKRYTTSKKPNESPQNYGDYNADSDYNADCICVGWYEVNDFHKCFDAKYPNDPVRNGYAYRTFDKSVQQSINDGNISDMTSCSELKTYFASAKDVSDPTERLKFIKRALATVKCNSTAFRDMRFNLYDTLDDPFNDIHMGKILYEISRDNISPKSQEQINKVTGLM